MKQSFKFIVNPKNTKQIEVTSLLQYCALKNTLSKLTSNNINPLKLNKNPVLFSNEDIDTKFTEYIRMIQSNKDVFKTKTFNECDKSVFFDALSECEYSGFLKRRKILRGEYKDTTPDYYIVDDLYTFFMSFSSFEYLTKYIPEEHYDVCYAQIYKTTDNGVEIWYDDEYISFDIINSNQDDKEDIEEFTKLVDCINERVGLQISKK